MFSRITQLLCFLFCTCIVFNTSSQSNIDISHYTKDYGVNFRWVYDITQDNKGFIWFANHTGLRRYDGENFITYQHSKTDKNSLSTNTLTQVSKDNNGNIWAYGIDGVFNKHDLESGKITRINFVFEERSPFSEMKDFAVLKNGEIIVLHYHNGSHGLWKYNTDRNTFEKQMDIPSKDVSIDHFTQRSDGKFWLWGMGKGYYLVDISSKSYKHFPIKASGKKPSVPVDINRNFWYPSNISGSEKAEEALKSFKLPTEVDISQVERLTLDNSGNIWFYHGDSDVYKYDVNKHIMQRLVNPIFNKSKGVQLMYHFFEDQEGSYWNGHFFGAIRFSKRQDLFNTYFTQQYESESLVLFNAREIIELSPTSLLVKENDHSIYTVDLVTQEVAKLDRKHISKSGKKIDNSFYSMVLERDDYLWTNNSGKIIRTNLESGEEEIFEVPKSSLPEASEEDAFKKYWPRIFIDASENLWWCGPDGLRILNKSNNKLESVQVAIPPLKVNADFKYAQYDPLKDAIYGRYDKGIYIIDCRKKTVSLLEIFSIQESYDILVTSILNWNNEFWLSTNKGLVRFSPSSKARKFYKRKDGLPSSVVYSTLAAKNHLWLATNYGLCQLDPYQNNITNYYKEDGLPSNNFNMWSSVKTLDGRLYFGGQNGIIGFDPDNTKMRNSKEVQLNLIEISKYNQKRDIYSTTKNLPYIFTDKIISNANERTMLFKYIHTNYENDDKSTYSHYLEGLENKWINDGTQNEIRYVEIPPGDYTFHARVTGPNNVSAQNEITIPIKVQQYWYLRWWCLLGYIAITSSAIYFLYKRQLRRNLDQEDAIRIKELDEVKTRMYTNITHEFRTPLTVMLGMNDAVRDYTSEGELDKVYHANEMIDRNGKNLLSLINQMLELSKLEAGVLKINNRKGNIVDYLKYRMESFQSYGEAKKIQIHFNPTSEEIIMDFDVDKISYIVGNLVSNALKFTPKNGEVHVQVSKTNKGNHEPFLELKIRDTGIGIDDHKIDHIFDRFYQVNDSNIRKSEGTGIGLSLVSQLVKLLKGDILVKSKINEGTEFTVLLPITTIAKKAEAVTSLGLTEEWSENIYQLTEDDNPLVNDIPNKPLVLIVEDNPDVAHYISVSLKDGYRTIRAENGADGIQKAIDLVPDIIISDVMMPEKDGYELCEVIKKDERTSHIPIILLTGKADLDSKIQGLEHGADVYLSKPFNRKELQIRLKNLLALRAEIQKHYSESGFKQPISGLSKVENEFLLKIQTAILENIEDENFSITKLCELVHLSRAQLHRKLVAITGESTTKLIRRVQLEKAKKLLSSGKYNVSEVAYLVGFKTQAHFSRVFSEAFGQPPSFFSKPI
jgi:signal transduction histidine kinase/DNA-binding response OmpR family regulator/streptogramin lyase